VENAIQAMQLAMQSKSIAFQHVVDPRAGAIFGDAQRLQQVLCNLLSNAVKFTPRGGKVRLLVERVDSSVTVTVSDTGQGIAPNLLSVIFERFRQADGSTARVHGGLGLGLAIARHIVELHGGEIEAHSDGEGRGATFIVRLPVAPFGSEGRGPFARHPLASDIHPELEHPEVLKGLTVLVVDDEQDSRDLLAEVLRQCGCSVLSAGSAEQALEILDRASPRVIVCDIGMPGMDGYGFIEKVRERPPEKGGRTVALAVTAYAGAEDRRRALRAGFQMHLAKPLEPAEFVAMLANLAQLAIAMS
jgi:CheY-like chemotaxis protein